MGNVLCKNRANRSGNNNTSNGKNPVDRVIGECMQICPNGIRKKKHFWEKQVFETAPPSEPLQEQPKSQQKNGWQNASLTVPDHPVAPPRKKRTLQRNTDPSEKNAFEEINLNGEIPEKYNERSVDREEYNERSVDPPEPLTTTTSTNVKTNQLSLTNSTKNDVPQKVTRTVSKVGNKKSDKFFGESLSDLSNDYENDKKLETTTTTTTTVTKTESTKNDNDQIQKSESQNKKIEENFTKNKNNEEIKLKTQNSTDKIVQEKDSISAELARESVIDLVEDIEEELNRKITKERGNLLFAIEKHLKEEKPTEDDLERFKDEKPCVEEVIVPVRRLVKRHICDDDDKIKEFIGDNPTRKQQSQSQLENDIENQKNSLDPNAPKKPQRDFAKYRKSLNGDEFDISQIIEAVNLNEEDKSKEKKIESSTQTTGKIAVREKAHHAKQEAENISKNVKLLLDNSINKEQINSHNKITQETSKSPIPIVEKTSSTNVKAEMKNFLDNIGKLKAEINKNAEKQNDEIENVAKDLVDNVLDTAQDCIKSGKLQSEFNSSDNVEDTVKIKNQKNELYKLNDKIQNKEKIETNNSQNVKFEIEPQTKMEEVVKKDYLQEIITAPILKLSDKTTAALKEAQALKEELNSSMLIESNILKHTDKPSNILSENLENDTSEVRNEVQYIEDEKNHEKHLKKEKSVEDCIDCMKNDASEIIKEVVEYAEQVVNDPNILKENIKNNFSTENATNRNLDENEKIKKLMKKPSITLFEENGTENFIIELKKEATQTVKDVCEYAQKTINKNSDEPFQLAPKNDKNINGVNLETEEISREFETNLSAIKTPQKNSLNIRPNRISEITPPTQLQQHVYRRAFSTQSVENDAEENQESNNDKVFNEIFSAVQVAQEKSKSTDNILENDKINHGLPPRPSRNSEINKPSLINSEKILRRCLSTQSYLTPNLIEKIALQANILSMPDPEDMGTNDGSSLVSPNYRLDSKRSVINSQSSLNSEKSTDSDIKNMKSTPVPPLPPKKPVKEEINRVMNEENKFLIAPQINQKSTKMEISTLPLQTKEQKITAPAIVVRSPITTRSPSPARPSRIPELPKSKLTKRLSRSTSKQSNPDLTDIKKSQELSETLKKFLNEKDLKPQEILDLIEFEFGDDMFFELLSDNDKKIINELKKSVQKQQIQKSSPPPSYNAKPPQKSPPSRSASREQLIRQNSQSSDSSSSKKSPDRLKSSRIPILKNNKINELQNNNSEFRRHSIDDLDSWFNPIKNNLSRKRDNSLQYDYNFDENSMNSSLTEQNIAIKQFLDKKTKSSNDLSKSSIPYKMTAINFDQPQQNEQFIEQNDHSALLKYLENKN
ncbi:arrestin domain-containing protein F-like [Condylostylus longicornis]|uniref:arrestin domain-containing protein F-like n=1 Tax=Condylostylus longicornis TaxID=2530218 RepID=UPI00244DCB1F|nr:arrestin domain-containing protein F-like [Condylostylus longicornis]